MTNGTPPNYAILWPFDGGRKTISAGQVTVNLNEGLVFREPGVSPSTETLLTSLRSLQQDYIRSILIEADQQVIVTFDGGARYTIDAGEISRLIYTQLQQITITATVSTNVRVWGSTHPEGVPEKFSSSLVGGKVTNTPNSSVGRPVARITRGSALAATYSNIATFTVPGAGTQFTLREVGIDANVIGSVRVKLVIGGEQQFRGLVLTSPYAAPFFENTLKAGTVIRIQAQSLGGTYKVVGAITGVKF